MDSEMIRVSKKALLSVLIVYDGIDEADRGYQACQCSTFRSFVSVRHEAAQDAYEEIRKAIKKSPEKGVPIMASTGKQLLSFADAIDSADAAYPTDRTGNMNYRSYLRSVYSAALNRTAAEALRKALNTECHQK